MDYIALQQWVSSVHKNKHGATSAFPPAGQGGTAAADDTQPSIIFPAGRHPWTYTDLDLTMPPLSYRSPPFIFFHLFDRLP